MLGSFGLDNPRRKKSRTPGKSRSPLPQDVRITLLLSRLDGSVNTITTSLSFSSSGQNDPDGSSIVVSVSSGRTNVERFRVFNHVQSGGVTSLLKLNCKKNQLKICTYNRCFKHVPYSVEKEIQEEKKNPSDNQQLKQPVSNASPSQAKAEPVPSQKTGQNHLSRINLHFSLRFISSDETTFSLMLDKI